MCVWAVWTSMCSVGLLADEEFLGVAGEEPILVVVMQFSEQALEPPV